MSSARDWLMAESGHSDSGSGVGKTASGVEREEVDELDTARREQLVAVFLREVCGMDSSKETVEVGQELARCLTEATENLICTRLGHPRLGTDGETISEGACCRAGENGRELRRLSELRPGHSGWVQFLLPRPGHHLDQLAPLGIVPGRCILVRRLRPAVVIGVGETTLALDRVIADDIFVSPA